MWIGLSIVGCNFTVDDASPTEEGLIESPINVVPDQPPVTGSSTPTPTPSPSLTTAPQPSLIVASPSPSPTATALLETPTSEPTLGPWEHVVQAGESLIVIIAQSPYNYRENTVIDEILRLNNLSSANNIFAGQTLLIPRPTPTRIPQGVELTAAVIETLGGDPSSRLGNVALPANTAFGCHTVREGENIVSIIQQYGGATLEILAQLNPDISFLGCVFDTPSGGPNCNPFVRVDQCVQVPFPTPTPTKSPTPSGMETPTPTPTYRPPSVISPSDGSIAGAGRVELFWVGVGILEQNEYYLVEVVDTVSAEVWQDATRSTSLRLPTSLIPTDGQTHTIRWTVRVAMQDSQGVFIPIGPSSVPRIFQWQSR